MMLGTKLPLQEMARGWTPGLLPLHLGWGTSPKERRGGEEKGGGERLAGKKAKLQPVPTTSRLWDGGWGKSQILQPL